MVVITGKGNNERFRRIENELASHVLVSILHIMCLKNRTRSPDNARTPSERVALSFKKGKA